ncbi:MAG: hypothetical protein K9L24_03740 [Spirochaetia bacterium]|nr:hypothetical protein [Spirochaetia bacterium]MCF7953829.1 hypothetical protein [Spirochaetales bacterium]
MNARDLWSCIFVIVGSIAMIIGALDPLEGSIIILIGSGLVVLGTYLNKTKHGLQYWIWVFILILVGVGVMWIISIFGGIGGSTGRSLWWSLLILPYPVGWIMGIVSLVVRLIGYLKAKKEMKKTEK